MSSVNKTVLLANIQNCNPERCIKLTQNPSTHGYYALKSRLESSSPSWLHRFLDLGGLTSLVDALERLSGREFTNFGDAVLQLDCLGCIKAVLNSSEGLTYVLKQEAIVKRLVSALDTPNALPKKQIVEILTVLSVYSLRGHQLVTDALAYFQKISHQGSEYSLLLAELRDTDTATYRKSLLAFLNSIISGYKDLHERYRVRCQLIGHGLLDILDGYRRDQQDANLLIQLEYFWDMKSRDEDLIERTHSFDFKNPSEVFSALFEEVSTYPDSEQNLLHVLQDMYLLHATRNLDHSLLWDTLARTTQYITNAVDESETQTFLQNLEKLFPKSRNADAKNKGMMENTPQPLRDKTAKELNANKAGGGNQRPGSMDRDSGISISGNSSFYDNVKDGFKRQGSMKADQETRSGILQNVLEGGQNQRVPKRPVKSIPWTKIKADQAMKPLSIWRQITEGLSSKRSSLLDLSSLEDEFLDEHPEILNADDEIHILSTSDSLNLNLFLSRMDSNPDSLADCLLEGEIDEVGLPALRALNKIIPSSDQVEQLRNYEGERYNLAPAEQFLLKLSDFAEYRLLLEGLLFKAETANALPRITQQLKAMISATRDIMHHPGLRDFAKAVLEAGNFLNASNHIGPASGIKLDSIIKLDEIRGQHHHSNLMAAIVKQLEKKDESILTFAHDFPTLEMATSVHINDLRSEVSQINNKLKKFLAQLPSAGQKIKDMFCFTIEDIKKDVQTLHDNLTHLRSLSNQMAQYFCDDPMTFDLNKYLLNVFELCLLVKKCQLETSRNVRQHQIAMAKQQKLEILKKDAQDVKAFGEKAEACSSFSVPNSEAILETLMKDIDCGKFSYHHDNEGSVALDDQETTLMLSQINTSTPCRALDETADDQCSFAICAVREKTERKTYVDRVENIIAEQYHRDKQLTTASYLNTDAKEDEADGDETLKEQEESNVFQIKIYPKMDDVPKPMERRNAWIKRHRRINSDFNHSTKVDENWEKYQKEMRMETRRDESNNVVMSLGLEKEGRVLLADDVEELEKTLVDEDSAEDQPEEKPKRRSSFGFFRRFSNLRATLTQRDFNVFRKDDRIRKSKRGKKEKVSNKENCISEC